MGTSPQTESSSTPATTPASRKPQRMPRWIGPVGTIGCLVGCLGIISSYWSSKIAYEFPLMLVAFLVPAVFTSIYALHIDRGKLFDLMIPFKGSSDEDRAKKRFWNRYSLGLAALVSIYFGMNVYNIFYRSPLSNLVMNQTYVLSMGYYLGSCISLWRMNRAWSAIDEGRCVNCDYDLRQSPERCPECGRDVRA